jgi:hypothetical protein
LTINLQGDDEGVLAGHEDGHVGDHVVVEDQHQPEHEERRVLRIHHLIRVVSRFQPMRDRPASSADQCDVADMKALSAYQSVEFSTSERRGCR